MNAIWEQEEDASWTPALGKRVPIARKGNLYVMKAWVKEDQAGAKPAQGFGRQG